MTALPTRTLTAALLLTLALLLAACGGDGGAGNPSTDGDGDPAAAAGDGSTQEFSATVVTSEFSFDPGDISIPADQTVEIVVDNSGGVVEHDFALEEADVVIHADPGEVASGTFSVPAGTYTFYCSVPGHRASGMEGTLTAG